MESVKTPGQFLHTSNEAYGALSPDAECHEVNLAVTKTSFSLYPHLSVKDENPDCLYGGAIIQLFHKVVDVSVVSQQLAV